MFYANLFHALKSRATMLRLHATEIHDSRENCEAKPLRSNPAPLAPHRDSGKFRAPSRRTSMLRHLIPAVLLLAAAPALAQTPPPGPNRIFTGADLFDL